ncbi:MAG: hypothetical protein U2P89_05160, partial [Proteiniphilum sp.]|uniref:hypothetical protein n=1 Tax=Proteiniphilum sp. TaxID=1926877 RepID=UPI002AB813D4
FPFYFFVNGLREVRNMSKDKQSFSFLPIYGLIASKPLLVDKIGEFIYFFCGNLTTMLFLLRIQMYNLNLKNGG